MTRTLWESAAYMCMNAFGYLPTPTAISATVQFDGNTTLRDLKVGIKGLQKFSHPHTVQTHQWHYHLRTQSAYQMQQSPFPHYHTLLPYERTFVDSLPISTSLYSNPPLRLPPVQSLVPLIQWQSTPADP
ncbi:hypothetical protein FA13DRAFT_1716201 [Coprinellus micaceus]|uniref:Uncharacterized protein n=1 Tax=Coprinellus micaceus TaxID=71717 RepID=A0A4Y7SKU5_COPMI|nr:hypothetical protein FA13DRAFT_1716201 [Coprinellus micaceus]